MNNLNYSQQSSSTQQKMVAISLIAYSALVINTKDGRQKCDIALLRLRWKCLQVPPLASRSIFNMDLGPNVVRMMSATACTKKQ
jgi:hypothetical protein